jgi:hypothetical protein
MRKIDPVFVKCPVCGGTDFGIAPSYREGTPQGSPFEGGVFYAGHFLNAFKIICFDCSERQAAQQPKTPDERSPEALGNSGNEPQNVVSEKDRKMRSRVGRLAQIIADIALYSSTMGPPDTRKLLRECAIEAAEIATPDEPTP